MRTFLPFIIPEFAVNTRSGYSSEGGTTFTSAPALSIVDFKLFH